MDRGASEWPISPPFTSRQSGESGARHPGSTWRHSVHPERSAMIDRILASKDIVAYESRFEPLLDSDEAATLLKIHPKTLQRMARRGEIPAIQIGKLWRFRASELDAWMGNSVGP